jgi:hypothetical protein
MQLFPSLDACFGNTPETKLKGGCGWKELSPIVNDLLQNILLVGIFIGVLMIMYAGYVLVKNQGSAEARSRAKKIFINIFIGLFLLVGAYYIVEFILDTLNVGTEYRNDVLR